MLQTYYWSPLIGNTILKERFLGHLVSIYLSTNYPTLIMSLLEQERMLNDLHLVLNIPLATILLLLELGTILLLLELGTILLLLELVFFCFY